MALLTTKQKIKVAFASFWRWYERHYQINVAIATGLFALQVVHLYWLATDVIALRAMGTSFFPDLDWLRYLIIIVDYTEIPALISVSLLYINELRKKFSWRSVLFLILLNSQWLHLFWITDEFVVNRIGVEPVGPVHDHGGAELNHTVLPVWLAWVAILIDYLELPVMIDTIKKFVRGLRRSEVSMSVNETLADSDD